VNAPVLTPFSEDVFELQARLCQAMANSTRLHIVHEIRNGPCCVHDLATTLGLKPSSVSRHLAALRQCQIIVANRQGQQFVYQIASPQIVMICDLMRQVLAEWANHQSAVAEALTVPRQ
jgi:ArsR family transcriptional regulator